LWGFYAKQTTAKKKKKKKKKQKKKKQKNRPSVMSMTPPLNDLMGKE
jgi:hypothetical protein